MNDAALKITFDSEAELYNEARPHYPDELYSSMIKETQLPDHAHLLEIGPGTGQATVPLAERGYQITAIELGESLATVARRELARFKNVEVITGAFEDVSLPTSSFDLVYAATAFHWIKPELCFSKPYELLKPGGYLAIIHTNHVMNDADDAFFHASQPIYKKYQDHRPKSTKDSKSSILHMKDLRADPMDESLFETTFFKVFPMTVQYSADEYIKLLGTFSPTLAMPSEKRESFLQEIADIINREFDGFITKHYGMSLTIGKKI
jgi:ubiquinone/menaquinone biosynthesis C-methylase UbiE